jgi:hypothetical protein
MKEHTDNKCCKLKAVLEKYSNLKDKSNNSKLALSNAIAANHATTFLNNYHDDAICLFTTQVQSHLPLQIMTPHTTCLWKLATEKTSQSHLDHRCHTPLPSLPCPSRHLWTHVNDITHWPPLFFDLHRQQILSHLLYLQRTKDCNWGMSQLSPH